MKNKPSFAPHLLAIPLLGAASLWHGVHDDSGIISLLYIIGGIFLAGSVFFDLTEYGLTRSAALLFHLLGLLGAAAFAWEEWGDRNWFTAYVVALMGVFGATAFAMTLIGYLKNSAKK